MKQTPILIFCTILCIYVNFQFVSSIDQRWRRAEVILSGLKDSLQRGYGRPRFVELTINGIRKFTRQMKSTPNDADIDDDFVAQHVVNNYDSSFNTNNYYFPDPILTPSIFESPLNFGFHVYFTNTNNALETILMTNVTRDFRCAANADRLTREVQLSSTVKVDVYVSFRCHGYHGLGCRFLCDVGDDVPYECLYDNNEMLCKNPEFNNPPQCNQKDTTCTVNPCLNGGNCVRVTNSISYCECPAGYMGEICNITFCENPCDPDFGECVGPNTCRCAEGWGGPLCDTAVCNPAANPCSNNGTCQIVLNEVICECDPSRFAGKRCTLECDPPCIFGTCLESQNLPVCQCFEGFIGETCNTTLPEPEAIFEDGYISIRNQRIIYVAVTGGLILIAVIVFGIGSYQRTHKKRNMRVMKGAETAMRTLQMNQQLNQTLSNSQMGNNRM